MNASLCAGYEIKSGAAVWAPIAAPTVGAGGDTLVFCGANGPVTGLRYAQSDWPLSTIYSKEMMPAAPFSFPNEEFVGPHAAGA